MAQFSVKIMSLTGSLLGANQHFMAEIDGFVDCVENGAKPLASFEDGRKALILAEAAYLSSKEGRLVKVSEISG